MTRTTSLGKRIQELRKERSMTQQELADKAGFETQSAISKIEKEDNERVGSVVLQKLASAFRIPGLDIVRGTSGEEPILTQLLPRFCPNHDPVIDEIPRLQDGFENKFCYDCGQELRGDCQHCGTPIECLSQDGGFCHVCGKQFDPFWESMNSIFDRLFELYLYRVSDDAFDRNEYTGPVRLCLAPHEGENLRQHMEFKDEDLKANKDKAIRGLVFPRFSLAGEVKYCPECGRETIDACPRCERPLFKSAPGYALNFCVSCGLNFQDVRPEDAAKSPEK